MCWSHGDHPALLLDKPKTGNQMKSFPSVVFQVLAFIDYMVLLPAEKAYCSTWRLSVLLPDTLKLFTSSKTNSVDTNEGRKTIVRRAAQCLTCEHRGIRSCDMAKASPRYFTEQYGTICILWGLFRLLLYCILVYTRLWLSESIKLKHQPWIILPLHPLKLPGNGLAKRENKRAPGTGPGSELSNCIHRFAKTNSTHRDPQRPTPTREPQGPETSCQCPGARHYEMCPGWSELIWQHSIRQVVLWWIPSLHVAPFSRCVAHSYSIVM